MQTTMPVMGTRSCGSYSNGVCGRHRGQLNDERFKTFVSDLSGNQIAVVSVSGMVCDFCARGIEKTFQKDAGFKKIDVDLEPEKSC